MEFAILRHWKYNAVCTGGFAFLSLRVRKSLGDSTNTKKHYIFNNQEGESENLNRQYNGKGLILVPELPFNLLGRSEKQIKLVNKERIMN